jgi:hypothetical protein
MYLAGTCQWHAGTVSRPLKGNKAMDRIISIREFLSHTDALRGQETDRKAGHKVGQWFAYRGTTSYTVTLPREAASVKLEGES